MGNDSIDRIRTVTFTVARRGYDKREVDRFMSRLADWLEGGGADQAARETGRNELERIGQKTAKILTAAEDAALSIRAEAEQSAQEQLEDSRRRAREIEKVTADLEKRRDAVLRALQKLSGDLARMATSYESGEGPGKRDAAAPPPRRTSAASPATSGTG